MLPSEASPEARAQPHMSAGNTPYAMFPHHPLGKSPLSLWTKDLKDSWQNEMGLISINKCLLLSQESAL